jgi:hypothetical protein
MFKKGKECWRKGDNVGERERMLEKGKECRRKGKKCWIRERMFLKGTECWRKGKTVGERDRMLEKGKDCWRMGKKCWRKGKKVSYFILSLSISYPHIFSLSLYLNFESNNVGKGKEC